MSPEFLYVHAPFCLRRCSYCDFAVTVSREPPVRAWLGAVERELAGVIRDQGWDRLRLKTLYVGGGTPSLLGLDAMAALRTMVERHADLAQDVEFTAEANPETMSAALAADWRAAGVNRVSLGVQTFHEPALRWMGRMHGADGPGAAVEALRAAGLENLSVDLIFGLPARLGRSWSGDLDRALALEPRHVSLYGLTAEAATPLGRWVAAGREELADEDRYAAEYLLASERLSAAGFAHYEVSNFERAGARSRHNAAYWTGAPYLGLGAGAHSFAGGVRWWNERDWSRYERVVRAGGTARTGEERIDAAQEKLERAWLGLRTDSGIALEACSLRQRLVLAEWEQRGWARSTAGLVRLTPTGWLLLDRLTVELDAAA